MKHLYLALALLGTVLPYSAFLPWLAEHGLSIQLFVSDAFAPGVPRFFTLDVIISALVVFVMMAQGKSRGVKRVWPAILGTLLVGVSCGLPLYLYLEER